MSPPQWWGPPITSVWMRNSHSNGYVMGEPFFRNRPLSFPHFLSFHLCSTSVAYRITNWIRGIAIVHYYIERWPRGAIILKVQGNCYQFASEKYLTASIGPFCFALCPFIGLLQPRGVLSPRWVPLPMEGVRGWSAPALAHIHNRNSQAYVECHWETLSKLLSMKSPDTKKL